MDTYLLNVSASNGQRESTKQLSAIAKAAMCKMKQFCDFGGFDTYKDALDLWLTTKCAILKYTRIYYEILYFCDGRYESTTLLVLSNCRIPARMW